MLAGRLFENDSNVRFLAGYCNHAATDWLSGAVIWNEFWQAYEAYMIGLQPRIATAASTFEDFCDWEASHAGESQVLERLWTDRLAGAEPLPGAGQTSPCIEIPVKLESTQVLALQAFGKANSLSGPFILTALFAYACSNVMDRRRLAIGYYMAGRLPRFSHSVGCFSQLRAFVPTNRPMSLKVRLKADFAAYVATLDIRKPVPQSVADRLHLGDICVNIIPSDSFSAPRAPIGLLLDAIPPPRRTVFRRNLSLFLRIGPAGATGGLWVARDRISEGTSQQVLKEWLDLLNVVGVGNAMW